ncbi:DNA-binding response regulator [Plantactinospora sp. KBS50]|nr:DNA-binding response regulator [Plantactinospora sp. KBS50]
MREAARVLVVDDQPNIVDMLATVLRFHGFQVSTAGSAAEAVRCAAEHRPDVVVLDVMLPDGDGFDVCRELRAGGHEIGIVFLTARDAPGDKINGLTYGGDDYVTKPFSVDELVARVRAVLRRIRPAAGQPQPGVLRFADVELDEEAIQVRRAGRLVELSPTEFKLLRYFMRHPNRVLSRAQILGEVWSYDFGGTSNVVDTYVGYLRRKLDQHGPTLIATRRGFGYTLTEG